MAMSIELPDHFLRLGSHAEKEYFLEHEDLYGGFIFNANLVSITTAACSSLAAALGSKPFLIDPWTFVYGLRPELLLVEKESEAGKSLEVKSSYLALAKEYGSPVKQLLTDSAYKKEPNHLQKPEPELFKGEKLQTFADNVLRFERTILEEEMEEDEYFGVAEQVVPDALIAPYFYNASPAWLEVNLALLDASLDSEQRDELPVLPNLCLPRELLKRENRSDLDSVLDAYRERECDGYLLWINDFDEKSLATGDQEILEGFLHAVQALHADGASWVMNMFGGYFSVASLTAGLSAVSHAVGYGEQKSVEPPSGGTPVAKYYFPPLHRRINAESALLMVQEHVGVEEPVAGPTPPSSVDDILERSPDEVSGEERERIERFFSDICDCATCQDVVGRGIEGFQVFAEAQKSDKEDLPDWLKDRKYPTGRAKRKSNLHYLRVRRNEVGQMSELDEATAAGQLRQKAEWFSEAFPYPPEGAGSEHLLRWANALDPTQRDSN